MIYALPITSAEPHYSVTFDFDGVEFVLRFDWNQRDGAWYMSLELPDGTPLMLGHKVVLRFPMFRRVVDARRPAGELVFIDTSGTDAEPGRLDLGARVVAVYVDGAEAAAA